MPTATVSGLEVFSTELARVGGLGAEVGAPDVVLHGVLGDVELGAEVALPGGGPARVAHLAHVLAAVPWNMPGLKEVQDLKEQTGDPFRVYLLAFMISTGHIKCCFHG